MDLLDSRRLTGPNLLLDRPGAVLEVSLPAGRERWAADVWEQAARRILDAVGWQGEEVASHLFPGGASLAISAPIDGLYSATEITEWAWEMTEAVMAGTELPDLAEAAARLRVEIGWEANPALLALRDARLGRARHGIAHVAGGRAPRPRGDRLESGP
jgi:cyanophycin synthetase